MTICEEQGHTFEEIERYRLRGKNSDRAKVWYECRDCSEAYTDYVDAEDEDDYDE